MHICSCNESSFTLQGPPPQITQPYQAPDVCSTRNNDTTGGGGGEDSGAAHLVYSTLAVTLVALLALLI